MYKKISAIVLGCMLIGATSGLSQRLIVTVAASSGFYHPSATDALGPGLLDAALNPSGEALLQLIFSPVNRLESIDAQEIQLAWEDDHWLSPRDLEDGARILGGNQAVGPSPLDAGEFADGFAYLYQEDFQAGFLFARIFSGPLGGLGVGDFAYQIGGDNFPIPTESKAPTGSPQILQMNLDLAFGGGPGAGDLLTVPIVPEPSSLLLLGIGAFGIIGARRRRIV